MPLSSRKIASTQLMAKLLPIPIIYFIILLLEFYGAHLQRHFTLLNSAIIHLS